jgi:type II secretory pathway predicted ATPase ExeA
MKAAQPFWNHWGLLRNPFGNIGSADDVFESREIARIMERLYEAVEEGGIHAITGERGIGKTTAKNELLNMMEENRSRYAYSLLECMDLGNVSMATIHSALIMDLSSERQKMSSEARSRQVTRIMGELAATKKIALVIDEAQRLPIETLEKLKMLTERRWAFRTKLISVLLFGQAELIHRLSRDEGLTMRVTKYRMSGFSDDEVLQYIDLRCRTAGGNMKDIFDDEVLVYIAENQHSPLHINHVCSSAMRMARQIGEQKVTCAMIYETGGIRSPRQILKDNGITVTGFARDIHMHDQVVTHLLNGDESQASAEQKARFHAGLSNISRGTELDTGDHGEEYSERQKAAG